MNGSTREGTSGDEKNCWGKLLIHSDTKENIGVNQSGGQPDSGTEED